MENDNYGIHFNALKYVNSGVLNIKGRSETKRCLVVPIEDNHLFESVNEDGSPKAVYLDLNAFALREPKYEQTHIVKQSLPKDVRESMNRKLRTKKFLSLFHRWSKSKTKNRKLRTTKSLSV